MRRFGTPLGHAYNGQELDYITAREKICLPTCKHVPENVAEVKEMTGWLRDRLKKGESFVFPDYNTNGDEKEASSPLSHASLVKAYIEGRYPDGSQQSPEAPRKPEQLSLGL